MIRTALILIATIIAIPAIAVYYWEPPSTLQLEMLKTSGTMVLIVAGSCFILSRVTSNCSQVDKIWSVMPIVYAWYFASATDFNIRITMMAVLVTIWGARLTFNFGRRGAYRLKFWEGEEDYRWEVLRKREEFKNPVAWILFELLFISLYQNVLIWLFTLPAIMASDGSAELTIWDYIIASLFIGLIVYETIADQQQWNFQSSKHNKIKTGESMTEEEKQGFVSTGLWKFSRHPNYAAEQMVWIVFYLFSIVVTGSFVNWSLAGAFLLVLLFIGSSNFSEEISVGKYPAYKDYQKRVPKYFPKFW